MTATQGGGGISPTYGAGLWLLDYVMQMLLLGTDVRPNLTPTFNSPQANLDQALYFHQGTIGNCESPLHPTATPS